MGVLLVVLSNNWQLVSRYSCSFLVRTVLVFSGTEPAMQSLLKGHHYIVVINCIVVPKHAQIDIGKHRSLPLPLLGERTPCNVEGWMLAPALSLIPVH